MNESIEGGKIVPRDRAPRLTPSAPQRHWRTIAGTLAIATLALGIAACGKLLTTAPDAGDLFDSPIDGLTTAELAAFQEGDVQFGKAFSIAEGLGPIFNNVSCASCHSGDGRGRPENVLTRCSALSGRPVSCMSKPKL